jgi:DNA repair protein RadC
MQNSKEYLDELCAFANTKRDFSVNDEKTSLIYIFESTDKVLSGTIGYSEKEIDIIRLTAALNSRRITDKFKIGKKYLQNKIVEYLVGLFYGSSIEKIFVLGFSESGKLLCSECVSEGTVNTSSVIPRKITEILKECGATRVILAHNHPQGVTTPSDADVAFTADIKYALKTLGIKLDHHYIVAGFDAFDFIDMIKEEN